jgi:hypothetical protein
MVAFACPAKMATEKISNSQKCITKKSESLMLLALIERFGAI